MFNCQKEKLVTRVFRVHKHGAAAAAAVHTLYSEHNFSIWRVLFTASAVGRNIIIASLAHV